MKEAFLAKSVVAEVKTVCADAMQTFGVVWFSNLAALVMSRMNSGQESPVPVVSTGAKQSRALCSLHNSFLHVGFYSSIEIAEYGLFGLIKILRPDFAV